MNDYIDKFRNMKDELVTVQRAVIEQAESIGEYESLIDDMTEEYEATIQCGLLRKSINEKLGHL